jgi:hypothetical protein
MSRGRLAPFEDFGAPEGRYVGVHEFEKDWA